MRRTGNDSPYGKSISIAYVSTEHLDFVPTRTSFSDLNLFVDRLDLECWSFLPIPSLYQITLTSISKWLRGNQFRIKSMAQIPHFQKWGRLTRCFSMRCSWRLSSGIHEVASHSLLKWKNLWIKSLSLSQNALSFLRFLGSLWIVTEICHGSQTSCPFCETQLDIFTDYFLDLPSMTIDLITKMHASCIKKYFALQRISLLLNFREWQRLLIFLKLIWIYIQRENYISSWYAFKTVSPLLTDLE
jgi:hypothetical protein